MATTPTQPVLEQISPKATYYAAGVTAAVGKLDELETATRAQIEGYDPATDTGWP